MRKVFLFLFLLATVVVANERHPRYIGCPESLKVEVFPGGFTASWIYTDKPIYIKLLSDGIFVKLDSVKYDNTYSLGGLLAGEYVLSLTFPHGGMSADTVFYVPSVEGLATSASEAVVIIHQPQAGAIFSPGDVELSWDEWRLVGDQAHPTEIYLQKNNGAQFFCGTSNSNSFAIKNLDDGSYSAVIRAFEKTPIGVDNLDPQDYVYVPVEGKVGFEVKDFSAVSTPELLPERFSLAQNFPNPFNPTTTISYDLAVKSHVHLTIFNAMGQVVAKLVDMDQTPGSYRATWNGTNTNGATVPSGIYFYRLEGEGFTKTMKMTLKK